MASAPPPPDDKLPTYEEAVTAGITLSTSGTRSYDSLPRSRADTGDYVVQYPVKTGQHEDEDVETALLKAELQRLRHENLEAKKQLLRQEIENERMKAGSAASNVYPYSTAPSIPAPQPSSSAIIPVRPLPPQDPEGAEAVEEDSCSDGKNVGENAKYGAAICAFFIVTSVIIVGVLLAIGVFDFDT